jgi:hypothetical protein
MAGRVRRKRNAKRFSEVRGLDMRVTLQRLQDINVDPVQFHWLMVSNKRKNVPNVATTRAIYWLILARTIGAD